MTLKRVKLGRAATFIKYLASVVSLIFLPKTLIWNKITFPASNLLNLAKFVKNELMKSISKKHLPIFFFLFDLSLLNVNTLELITKEPNNKNPHLYNPDQYPHLLLIMNYQSSNFGGEGS